MKSLTKEKKRDILLAIGPYLAYLILKVIYFTCKKKYNISASITEKPHIFAVWHGKLSMQPSFYKTLRKKPNIANIVSGHFDGKVLAKTFELFGFEPILGSTNKGGIEALKKALRIVKTKDLAITPDGPRGPRYSVADGIVAISQKRKTLIVPLDFKAESFWQFKTWDRLILPKPFTTLEFYAGDPFTLDGLDKQEAKDLIKTKLSYYE